MKTIRLVPLAILLTIAASHSARAQGTSAGKVDLSFNAVLGGVDGQVTSLIAQPNGQVIVGGYSTLRLTRLNANGSRDNTFNNDVLGGHVNRLHPRSDGGYYVQGTFLGISGRIGYTNIALIQSDGTHDINFIARNFGGLASSSQGAVLPDNRLLAQLVSNQLAVVAADGVAGTPFPAADLTSITHFTVNSNGQIYAAGSRSAQPALVRLNSDGSTDNLFMEPVFTNNFGTSLFFRHLVVQPDGRLLIVGRFTHVNGVQRGGLARLNTDGTLDSTFVPGAGGIGSIYQGQMIPLNNATPLPDGRIIITRDGPFHYNNILRAGVARLSPSGALDTGFDPGTGPAGPFFSVSPSGLGIIAAAAGANGEIYVGGVFTNFNGTGRRYVARLNSGPVSSRPTIVSAPQSQSVTSGVDVVFSVGATGPAPLTYVWKHNTTIIRGATNATLTVTNVQLADVGLYLVTVSNAAGTATAAPAVLTVNGVSVPDLTGPTFTIKSPAGTFVRSTTNQYTFSGTSKDNLGLASLSYQQDTNPWVQIPLTTNWSFTVTLQAGTNRFRLFVTDIANNNSATQSFVAFYVVTQALALTINGNGTVTGATNGQSFEIGRNYPFKATPKPGNLFSNWIANGVIVTSPSLTFFMRSNSTVTANFVTNPFIVLGGTYNGLFYQTNNPAWDSSGFFTLKLDTKGTYSGKLIAGVTSSSFTGGFDLSLASTKRILRPGKSDLLVGLQLTDGSDQISGFVSNVNFFSELGGYRATFSTTRPANNYVGKYNLLISGGPNPATSPFGHGFAKISVASGGVTTIGATLADGTAATQSVPLGEGGVLPLYMALYTGKGSIFGWLTILNTDTNDISGALLWTKTNVTTGAFYRGGFTNDVQTLGSRYIATNKPVLNFSNAVVLLEGANLVARTTNDVILNALNKITVTSTNTNKLVLTLNLASGQVTGTFLNPATGKSSPIKSVILQDQNSVGGFALGTNQSGIFYLGPPENFPLFQLSP